MAIAVGSRLSQYELTALIGERGMGRVFQARDTKLGRRVAVKVDTCAVSRDGQRFLIPRLASSTKANAMPDPIVVILNWASTLKP